jgi:predicted helicase
MDDTWNEYVPEQLLPRLFGFELLMAPYTIAHLKLSMLLQQLGYAFGHEERLGIYLTNALIELPAGQATLPFLDFLVEEGNQARAIKQEKPVMVVLGNPPYSNYGGSGTNQTDTSKL